MEKREVRKQIERIGLVPVIRASSPEEARFAAEAVLRGGIPIVEIAMTVPGAPEAISVLAKTMPEILVGAGTVEEIRSGIPS
jgi:2-dehydro-3-deoxyphosphogluconate aldolase / (4S)-4-hydroxy-2-oxoglutarate aldolase